MDRVTSSHIHYNRCLYRPSIHNDNIIHCRRKWREFGSIHYLSSGCVYYFLFKVCSCYRAPVIDDKALLVGISSVTVALSQPICVLHFDFFTFIAVVLTHATL
jgi:hypothetical protein